MKAIHSIRAIALLSSLTALSFAAFNAGLPVSAAPVRGHGGTGQALALRTSLHALVPPAARPKTFKDMVGAGPQDLRRASDGRFIYRQSALRPGALRQPNAAAGATPQVDEAVQTYDAFSPPPIFTPTQGPSLTPTNLTPVWTADETMLVFSSNRTATGTVGTRFHIWAIPVNGGTPIQLTGSSGPPGGGEFFPALSADNNRQLTFTSDANSVAPDVQNLYSIPVPTSTVDVTTLSSPTIRTDAQAVAAGGLSFAGVQRPTFVPGNSDEIVFSAFSTTGTNKGHNHLYFLYVSTGGSDPANVSLPAKLTDGPADDTDPAYSQDGQLIAFASNAAGLTATGNAAGSDPNISVIATSNPGTNRSIFLVGGGGRFGFGTVTNGGKPVTLSGTDNFGPAWSSLRRNPYTDPAPGFEYIAFSRGASPTAPHDVYYLQVLQNTDAGGETSRSNEAATTPELARAPIYQVNAGDTTAKDLFGNYVPDTFLSQPQGFTVTGGTAQTLGPPAPVINTTNDPGTPPQIYQTDRNGTFTYTFGNLTPGARYSVRLHLSDPTNNVSGKRVFNVTVNGATQGNIDIVRQVQIAQGRIDGLVSDPTGATPLAATITVTDASGSPVTTDPSPLSSATATSADPNGGAAINYNGALTQGTYTVTATPDPASGYAPASQTVTISSGAFTRLDFPLAQGVATINGTVNDSNLTGQGNLPVSVIDDNTGETLATTTTNNAATPGTFSVRVPPTPTGDKYDVTVSPPFSAKLTTQSQQTVVTSATPATVNFTLASGATTNAGIGTLGGLVTSTATTNPVTGATLRVTGANNTLVAILKTGATGNSPAAPSGDGKSVNYIAFLPVNAGYTVVVTEPGFTRQTATAAVVNTPATTTTPANAFTRADFALASAAPTVGQNTAIVVGYTAIASSGNQFFFNNATAGIITVAFNPVSGDPPIVEGIEILSDLALPNGSAPTSSGFGDYLSPNFTQAGTAASPPQILSAFGGVNAARAPQVTITFANGGTSSPTSYNLYRSPAALTSVNNPPISNVGTETPYLTNVPVTARTAGSLQTVDTNVVLGDEYYYQLTAVFTQVLTPETAPTAPAANPAIKLNTDDNPAQTSTTGNVYDDVYPTWSPFGSIFSIAYSSNRTVTYNDPATGATSETAISVPVGGKLAAGGTVGRGYFGILVSQVVNLDPPTLLPYSGNEIVHVADSAGNTTRYGITPGQRVTFTARLSSREAGIDNTGAATGGSTGAQVYLQIKNPNSKYQDAQGLEHKVFARDFRYHFQSNNPNATNPALLDSGSSAQLINGGAYPGFNQFTSSTGVIFDRANRGAIGGTEDAPGAAVPGPATNASDTISIGRDGGGGNGENVLDINGKPVTDPDTKQIVQHPPGSDPNLFTPWGPEFECQVVNPAFATNPAATTAGDTSRTDFRDPYYLAGVDDQQPFSGAGQVRPTTSTLVADGTGTPAEWLQMTRLPDAQQDGQGGALYSVTWTTPTTGSDYYMDVIAFDQATPPLNNGGVRSNWRIYDNIWGFSTAASIGNNDILVVSDYALGQKFAATTFGGQRGLLNLVPKLFGAESYVTDIDVNLLPNAVYRHTVITGANVNNPSTEVNFLGSSYSPTGRDFDTEGGGKDQRRLTNRVFNGLGVGSYFDQFINDGGVVDNVPAVRSQQYSIWRILSRGPIPASVYQAYTPTRQAQPAVADTSGTTKVTVAAGSVPVANRCIVWIAPFTGDVLAGAGTLADTATQTSLRNFVAAGGRLCVSGEDIGSTLTQNGAANNAAGGFLFDVLNATLATPNGGTHIPVLNTAPTIADNRITNAPGYDGYLIGNHTELNPDFSLHEVQPGQRLLRVSNNYGGNIFSGSILSFHRVALYSYLGNWRTDGSLDQLGPYIQPFPGGSLNTNAVVSAIDTITPGKGAHADITLSPFSDPIGATNNGNAAAASGPGGVGLIYTENPVTAAGGSGSKVVYATFGLEALSSEFYKVTNPLAPNPVVYNPRNQRQNIIHNIVDYLRTGTIAGTIRSTSGNGVVGSGVAGVTVYLQSAFGPAIPGRGTFSATTDSAGNYRIDGIEPGSYTLAAYRPGFIRAASNPGVVFTVEGDTLQQASLTLVPAAPGNISGKVSDTTNNLVAGATVTFTSTDGQVYSTTTDSNGSYTLSSVAPATYSGTAAKAGFGTQTQTSLVVASNTALTVNFTLQAGPGIVTGRVVDTSGNPIKGASVFFSSGSPAVIAATVTTDATGTYTVPSLAAGTYNVTASATGFGSSAPIAVVVVGGATTTVPDITLGAVVNGTLGGLVTGTGSTTPLAGVTLTITNTGTGQVVSPAPVTTATSTAASDGGQINYGPLTLGQGTYTVTAVKNGVTAGTQTVTLVANTFSRLDFTGINGLPPLHTFAPGLSFLSLPFDYSGSSIDSLFGALNTALPGTTPNGNRTHIAVWNPLLAQYALDPTPPADAIRLGVGYWIFLKKAVDITQPGVATTGAISVALHPSWNQIGVPSTSPVPVSGLTFATGTTVLSFADATSSANHLVAPTLYRYDGANYQTVSASDSLQPYQAYWIKVYVDTTVRIPTGR